MIPLANFQTNAYYIGDYDGLGQTVRGNHHKINFNEFVSSTVGAHAYPNVRKVDISPGADTVYLPYAQDQIYSVRLPQTNGPTFFCTANMSGCAFFIGVNDHGRNVVFHANSQRDSSERQMASKRPSFQADTTRVELDQLRNAAMLNHGDNVRIVGELRKSVYWRRVDDIVRTSSGFLGGTTVVGYRNGAKWDFWFQVWGSVNGGPITLIQVAQFF
ncbi:MAG: hypothetical protein R3F55_02330 [Alphaproteobacteria bacterium]